MDDRWRAWIAHNCAVGCATSDVVAAMIGAGLSRSTATEAVTAVLRDPVYQVAQDLAARLSRRETAMSALARLQALAPEYQGGITSLSGLSAGDFFTNFYARNRPVVLNDVAAGWPALARWNPRYLADVVGNVEVEIACATDRGGPTLAGVRDRVTVAFADFARSCEAPGERSQGYLVAESNLLRLPTARALHTDFSFDDRYLNPAADPAEVKLWLGGAATFTPLHYDPVNVLFVQVFGSKTLRLISPLHVAAVGNSNSTFADLPDIDEIPAETLDATAVLRIDVHPGQAVFIPAMWWHQVHALTPSISLSFTQFRHRNSLEMPETE